MKKHYYGLDLGKIIAAILVISIHTVPFAAYEGTYIYKVWSILSSMAVPFFFICTGFFIGERLKNDGIELLIKKSISFCKIYLLLTLCYLPLTIYRYVVEGRGLVKSIIFFIRGLVVFGNHGWSWQLWYLLCVSYSLAFLYILYKWGIKKKNIWIIALALYVIGTFFNVKPDLEDIIPGIDSFYHIYKMLLGEGRMFCGLIYIMIGMEIDHFKIPRKSLCALALMICFLICVFISEFFWRIALVILTFFAFSIFLNMEGGVLIPKLRLRKLSSYIYYNHMYFVFIVLSFTDFKEPGRFLFVTLFSVIFSYLYMFIRHLMEKCTTKES